MKIAFTSSGNGWNEKLDIRFGRAKGFFIFDTETRKTKFITNANSSEVAHGAGTSAARNIIEEEVGILITGKVGPKAEEVLKAGEVKIYNGMGYGNLNEAYENYNDNKLERQE